LLAHFTISFRPILIKKGADLPLLLIFAGVIGGLAAFGIIGLFIGPVVLSVSYRLMETWVADVETYSDLKSAQEDSRLLKPAGGDRTGQSTGMPE
jgi:predicted PurR-regulated permease PerM